VKIKKFLIELLFPYFCLGCEKEGFLVCPDCLGTIEVLEYQFCPFCKKAKRVLKKGVCLLHGKKNLDGLFAATSYQDRLVSLMVKKLKYKPYLKTLSEPLAFLIIAHFLLSGKSDVLAEENSVLVPLPLHPSEKRRRGYNQSAEIARFLSQYFKLPLLTNNLSKIKKTRQQVGLSEKERLKNVVGVFEVKNKPLFDGKKVFLVDDVFTSGATLEEAAKVLKESGAKEVWGVVAARETLA
jgi:ComF family protein